MPPDRQRTKKIERKSRKNLVEWKKVRTFAPAYKKQMHP
jgi:hypothetical protein